MPTVSYKVSNTDVVRFARTNFAGDPARDNYGNSARNVTFYIPEDLAHELEAQNVNVRWSQPGPRDEPSEFVPRPFVKGILSYTDRFGNPKAYPPKVYLVSGDAPARLQDMEMLKELDDIRIASMDISFSLYEYDHNTHKKSVYINLMYVVQDLDEDPFASKYVRSRNDDDMDIPFDDRF